MHTCLLFYYKPTPLYDETITSVNFDYSKAIVIDVSNLETSGEFVYFNLAVIKLLTLLVL
jgi:hypothetical protein